MTGRVWVSVPILKTGIRVGRSLGDDDWQPRLPGWKVYELALGLREASAQRGSPMTWQHARYVVQKARALGALDSSGNLTVPVKGTRETCIKQAREAASYWGSDADLAEAQTLAALARIDAVRLFWWWAAVLAAAIVLSVVALSARADTGQTPTPGCPAGQHEDGDWCVADGSHGVGDGYTCLNGYHREMDNCRRDASPYGALR